ncbi:flagellar biosynthesis protein FlhF [Ketobacter sp. MCCC 1A13808]|uniref:flagellar biosynthesis protein FlhF n=1 Tax=Ketobacter sp. MCCC 1A13808 TaxID=2602738 RepID=UPI0012EB1CC9|nr:flagellar biosynthesis protein FlhF [Ketobacter sp. MCCC 1A13808]MVF10901.1 flagellar biosynthesis protein FlhF [Ketobacter sp. MCCC 1A13808]
MNTRKFIAADMRQALNLVRDELGADAVILSNRKVESGIEIIAAVDYNQVLEQHKERERKANHMPDYMDNSAQPPKMGDPARVLKEAHNGYAPTEEEKSELMAALQRRGQANEQFDALLKQRQQQESGVSTQEPQVQISARARQRMQAQSAAPRVAEPAPVAQQQAPQSGSELAAMRGELSQLRQMLNIQMANVAWGSFNHQNPLSASVFKKLARLGLSPALCRKLVRNVRADTDIKQAWKTCLVELSDDLPLMQADIVAHGGVFAFVGPAGVGKTTTISKIATRYVLEHGAENLALVTTDSYRLAGHEQLSTLGRILNVPVRVVTEQQSLEQILRGLSRKKLVLIDTAGLSHKDQVHREQMDMLETLGDHVQRWLVLSSTTQRRILDKAVADYKHLNLDGCILTKLDESASLGEALSMVIESQLPIAYTTDGQNIPDDLQRPNATRLLNHAIALAKGYRMDEAEVADYYSDAISDAEAELAYA